MKNKRITVIGGVLVAAVAVFLVAKGYIPPRGNTAGTIGAAKRYSSQQIGDQDVTLKNSDVQLFLQSDTFHKLATDANFRNLVSEQAFVDALRDQAFTDALHNDAARAAIMSDAARSLIADGLIQKLSADGAKAVLGAEAARLMGIDGFRTLASSQAFRDAALKGNWNALDAGRSKVDYAAFKDNTDWIALKANSDYARAVASDGYRALVDNAKYAELADQIRRSGAGDLATALADAAVQKIVTNDGFRTLVDQAVFTDALRTPAFDQLSRKGDWAKAIESARVVE
jgi:hypothetical protein